MVSLSVFENPLLRVEMRHDEVNLERDKWIEFVIEIGYCLRGANFKGDSLDV